MHEDSSVVTAAQFVDPATLRIEIVGRQLEIEQEFVKDPRGRAFFFVKNPLTPLYIAPNSVKYDSEAGLFVIKPGFEDTIPKNLISKEVLEDPKQLSTVLGRVLSLDGLKESTILVFYINDRKDVVATAYENFKINHKNFSFIKISEEKYQFYKKIIEGGNQEEIPEATYVYHSSQVADQLFEQCVFATQANNPAGRSCWQILKGVDTAPAIIELNKLLKQHDIDLIPVQIGVSNEKLRLESSANELSKMGLFNYQPSDAANSSLSQGAQAHHP